MASNSVKTDVTLTMPQDSSRLLCNSDAKNIYTVNCDAIDQAKKND